MTKEELEKEAREYLAEHSKYSEVFGEFFVAVNTLTAMVDFAEPREKEIKVLGERCLQLQKDKGNLTDRVNNLEEKLANADYQLEGRDNEIRELNEKIEKMKECANCHVWLLNQSESNCCNCKYKEALILLRR